MIDAVFNVLKLSIAIAVAGTFAVAIFTLINLLASIVINSVVGEVFYVISCCLPFDAMVVFGGLIFVCNAVLSFLIAKKIFDLTSWVVSTI